MKTTQKTTEQKRRSLLMAFPVLAFPFITIIFFVLGGGKGSTATAQTAAAIIGLKSDLPTAKMKKEPEDKLSFYANAENDSLKRQDLMKQDPYYQHEIVDGQSLSYRPSAQQTPYDDPAHRLLNSNVYSGQPYSDQNEAMVYNKINTLKAALDQNQSATSPAPSTMQSRYADNGVNSGDIDRLEQMMKAMQSGSGSEDPEMQSINGMLEKILDIQHPERVQDKLRQTSEQRKGQVFPVNVNSTQDLISLLQQNTEKANAKKINGFYSFEEPAQESMLPASGIKAVVNEDQTLVSGSIIKLRLSNDVFINGVRIPRDNFLFGMASLNGERLAIKIENIQFNGSLFPVKLSVFDMDGIEGIHIPGAITRDVAKESSTNAIQGIGMSSLDPSLGAQAATAGIELTKSLIGKKVKLIKVQVKAGYQVLLRDENTKGQ